MMVNVAFLFIVLFLEKPPMLAHRRLQEIIFSIKYKSFDVGLNGMFYHQVRAKVF